MNPISILLNMTCWRQCTVTSMGLKYRAHPLAVAIAFEGLKNLRKYVSQKEAYARQIIDKLGAGCPLVPPTLDEGVQASWYSLVFQYDATKIGGLPIEKFYDALKAEGLVEVDRPFSTSPLHMLDLFQTPSELFPTYEHVISYKKGDFPKAEEFYKNAIKLPVWALNKDSKIVHAYIDGINKVMRYYQNLL